MGILIIKRSVKRKGYGMKILLANVRVDRKITLEKLASTSGVSKSTLQRIEIGAVSPTMETMERMAKGLDVKITELFESKYK